MRKTGNPNNSGNSGGRWTPGLYDDGTMPDTHREQLLQASRMVNEAAKLVGAVRLATPMHTPLSDRLGGLLADHNLCLFSYDMLLAAYKARKH